MFEKLLFTKSKSLWYNQHIAFYSNLTFLWYGKGCQISDGVTWNDLEVIIMSIFHLFTYFDKMY